MQDVPIVPPGYPPEMPPPPPPAPDVVNVLANLQQQQAYQRAQMEAAFMRLGTSEAAARAFMNNGITSLERLRMLSKEGLERLIKQMQRGIQGEAGVFIPFFTQESINAIHFSPPA